MALDQKKREADRVYEEFEPPIDWDHDEGSDTLILMLPGFEKEQLRVEVTSTRVVRVSGERQISENKWRRFRKEMAMPPDSDTSGISAKIEAGMLYVRLPKMIITNNNNNNKKKKKKQQQQSPTNNAPIPTPSTKPTQPPAATTTPTVPKQETPNPHPLQRIASYLKPSNRQKKPIVDEYLYKASEPGIDQPSDFYITNIRKKLQRGNNNNDPTPTVPPTKPPQPQQPTTDQKAAAEPPQKVEKGKARILTDDDIVNKERVEKGGAAMLKHGSGGGSDLDHGRKRLEKRSLTTEMVSRQSEEYMNAVSDLAEEVRKQKKLVKVLILTFLVLLFGIYVKNMQSSHLLERTPNACQL